MSLYDAKPVCTWCKNDDPELIGSDRHRIYGPDGLSFVDVDYGLICKACGRRDANFVVNKVEVAGNFEFASVSDDGERFIPLATRQAMRQRLGLAPSLVIVESPYGSPYAGVRELNVDYARRAVRDSLQRGEYPIASHLLYTQPGILRYDVPAEREWGIRAGLAWRSVAHQAVFYVDRGWSPGMLAAREVYDREQMPYEIRSIQASGEAQS